MTLFVGDIVGLCHFRRGVTRWRVLAFGYRLDERRGDWFPVARLEALEDGETTVESLSVLEADPGEPEEWE